jgi:nucleoside-diphosphate-sugar epimerase
VFAKERLMNDLHVVLGGSGGAGSAIVRALAATDHQVRAVNRGGNAPAPETVLRMAADITTLDGAAAAVAGASVVYLAAQPPYHRWPQEFPNMLDTVIDAVAEIGAKLVMVDNLYMYGRDATNITEDLPERGGTRKGDVRAEMAATLRRAHDTGRVRVAIGRASDYFGPAADNSGITALAIAPAAAGKTTRWMGRLDRRHSVAYLPDIARAFVTLGDESKADGETWILPHAPAPTGAEFLATVNAVLPTKVKTALVTKTMLRMAAPFHRISRESLEIAYQWTEDFVADDSKYQRVFGPVSATPLEEAVRTTVDWYRTSR